MRIDSSSSLGLLALAGGERIRRATVHAVHADGSLRVEVAPEVPLDPLADVGRCAPGDEVLAWLPADAADRGVVLGRIAPRRDADELDYELDDEQRAPAAPRAAPRAASGELPDELVLEAREQLTLRVGDGSITIRADGRILVRGTDLVSHAKRTNRIRGGAVSIN